MLKVYKYDVLKMINRFANAMGLDYISSENELYGEIDGDLIPIDDTLYKITSNLNQDFKLLLDYLGVEIESGKRIVKIKKGKK